MTDTAAEYADPESPETAETPERVRVPNIHPHAVSGLDHVALGDDDRDALNVPTNPDNEDHVPGETVPGVEVAPPEELPDQTGAVASAETSDDTSGSQPDDGSTGTADGTEGPEGTDDTIGDAPQDGDGTQDAASGDDSAPQGDSGSQAQDSPDEGSTAPQSSN